MTEYIKVVFVAIALMIFTSPGAPANDARLIDQNGQTIAEKDFGPSYRLLYFGYTHCPDACPVALQVMSDAIDRLGRIGETITPVFITIDPSRDTPELLKRYVDMFHPRFKAVSGDEKAIGELASTYKVVFTKVDMGPDRPYSVDHSTSIYLTDNTGRLIGRFLHSMTAPQLATKIAGRLAREP